jgi:hypothetical protein
MPGTERGQRERAGRRPERTRWAPAEWTRATMSGGAGDRGHGTKGIVRSLLSLDRKRFARSCWWHSRVIRSKQYVLLKKTIRLLSVKPREAAGSTSEGASPSMPISLVGFVEAQSQSYLFVSFWWLIPVEST